MYVNSSSTPDEGDSPGISGNTSPAEPALIATAEEDYFVFSTLPTLVALLFVIPWKIISTNLKSMEPFHQLLGPKGAKGDHSILLSYAGASGVFAPILALKRGHWLVAIGSVLEYGSALVPPLAAESVIPGLI